MFRVTPDPIQPQGLRAAVEGPGCGAVVLFFGVVRDRTAERRVTHLEYEAYEPMALAQMERIAQDLEHRLDIGKIACAHRIGRLEIGEDAMVVAVSAPHRAAALQAVAEFITRLKRDVPIWKKEHFEGGAVWVGTPENPQGRGAAIPEEGRDA